ncbi:hypothetical protein [Aquaspirillum sp. LM1]|uniref:hypothetical protein n=1 Tax=Aquaspirillum sp. LM1 TaxID=1938604 RepID=UPI001237709B|nr:hypothetical protein [Aquaspirillum sp. LM1]
MSQSILTMGHMLDCSTYSSAKKSLAAIFGINEIVLIGFLRSIVESTKKQKQQASGPEKILDPNIYQALCGQFGEPKNHTHTKWFHGTRTGDIASFKTQGILTRSRALELLRPILSELAVGLTKTGKNPFEWSSSVKKDNAMHDGPYGFLIKDSVINKHGIFHDFYNRPEAVEEIAGELLGENWELLMQRFQSITKPYVVSFWAEAGESELADAATYLYDVEDGKDGEDVVTASGKSFGCFNSFGEIVCPSRIVAIDDIPPDK